MNEELRIYFWYGEKVSRFSIMSGPAMGPTQPPIQWVPGLVSPRLRRQVCETENSLPSNAGEKNGGTILQYL
jgi:hypothetical protein